MALALQPFFAKRKLTPYLSNIPISDKIHVLKSVGTEMGVKVILGSNTMKDNNYYQFFYQPDWWASSYTVTILFTGDGYYINCQSGGYNNSIVWGNDTERAQEVIDGIKEFEAKL